MSAYIAMLRGANVGGKTIKMARLRAAFEELGFTGVGTYVQSGNVVFETAQTSSAKLAKRIEGRIVRDFGLSIPVFVKTAKEMANVVARNPFMKAKGIDVSKLHVTFLSDTAPKTASKTLKALAAKSERFHVSKLEVYLYCPNGYGKSKLSNSAIERKLSVVATTRNWKTVNALLKLARQE